MMQCDCKNVSGKTARKPGYFTTVTIRCVWLALWSCIVLKNVPETECTFDIQIIT